MISNLFVVYAGVVLAEQEPLEKSAKKPVVFVREARPVFISDELIFPARVESKINANLAAESDGQIKKIETPLGSRVKRGDVLLTMNHTDPIFEYRTFKVRSPISGLISALSISEGSLVKKGDLLVSITDPSDVQIRIEIPASDRKSISPGAKGEFRESGSSSAPKAVVLSGLSPQIDALTGTSVGLLKVIPLENQPKAKNEIATGTTGQVRFKVNGRNILQVPEGAVTYRDQDTFLKIIKDQKVEEIKVALGASTSGKVEILSGLKPSDQVIERSSRYVSAGEQVEVTSEKASGQ